jgi:hypothetical protein
VARWTCTRQHSSSSSSRHKLSVSHSPNNGVHTREVSYSAASALGIPLAPLYMRAHIPTAAVRVGAHVTSQPHVLPDSLQDPSPTSATARNSPHLSQRRCCDGCLIE